MIYIIRDLHHKDLIWVIPEGPYGFTHFLHFKSEFCNKELMIWATVSTRSCFCCLYRATIFGYKEYILNDFSIDHVVMMSMCSLFSCFVGRGCLLWPVCSFGKTVTLCPAHIGMRLARLGGSCAKGKLPTSSEASSQVGRSAGTEREL